VDERDGEEEGEEGGRPGWNATFQKCERYIMLRVGRAEKRRKRATGRASSY
jgi:hypothetical protein